ncbi:hypothetical protein ACFE04_005593 [Oxalis oulophora]
MFRLLFLTVSPETPKIKHLYSLFTIRPLTNTSLPNSIHQSNQTQFNSSPIDFTAIANSVISRCSHLLLDPTKKDKPLSKFSLKTLLLDLSYITPDIIRRYGRLSVLKPHHVLQILLGFESQYQKLTFGPKKVGTLWEFFKLSDKQQNAVGFKHLPKSCEVMASMLNKAGMLKELELLLLGMELKGISMDSAEVFCDLIVGYVRTGDIKRAVFMFDRIRGQGLVPSLSCYSVFVDSLVKMKRTKLVFRVCMDLADQGIDLSTWEKVHVENLVKLLCTDKKIQEARTLIRKVTAAGFEPSNSIVNDIACGYCAKKDFKDLQSFFIEMKRIPDVTTGNKIIHTISRHFGVESSELFLQDLQHLGFVPDEVTFGILIAWSCRKRNLRNAFLYLSEILSKGLKPDLKSYNALISALFNKGLWNHVHDILDEMRDQGISPDFSTFRALLAGYCKARHFDEAKMIVKEMVDCNLIELGSVDDSLSEAFKLLGLDTLVVRLKRDNNVGLIKTEFYDNLGNGMYLDTDLEEYDDKLSRVLEDSIMPDFNSLVIRECETENLTGGQLLVNEMIRWGQEPSLPVYSALMKGLCKSRSHLDAVTGLLEKMPQLAGQLNEETLNSLVQTYSKKGLTHKAKTIFNEMFRKGKKINNETCTDLMIELCRRGKFKDLSDCWAIAEKNNWLLDLKKSNSFVKCLSRKKMLSEALHLLKSMLISYPRLEVCNMFIGIFCQTGYANISHIMVEEILQRGCDLDDVAFSHLLEGLCIEKKFSVAFTVLDMMLAKKLTPCLDALIMLIPQMCVADKFIHAIELREVLLEESKSTFLVDGALIKGFCMTGKLGKADCLFMDMLKGSFINADIYNVLLQGHCKAKNSSKVNELFGLMIRKNIDLSLPSYRSFTRMKCAEHGFFYSLNLKEFMLQQTNSCSLVIYNILIFYLFLAGNCSVVNKVLNEMQEKNLLPDQKTYDYLVYGFSQCKEFSSSMLYLSRMIDKGHRPSNRNLRAVISHLCKIQNLKPALELSRKMELRGWIHDSTVQNAIIESFLSFGKLQDAENFFDRIVDKGLVPNNINYDNLIILFCGYGKFNKAIDMLDTMLRKGNIPNSTSYDSVISSLCECNNLEQAMDFHTEMLDRKLKPSTETWDILVHSFCKEGMTDKAERLLYSMVESGEIPSKEMYSIVVDRYQFENNLRKASDVMETMQRSGYKPDFEAQWSLISKLSSAGEKEKKKQGFLSTLLSGSGFSLRKHNS